LPAAIVAVTVAVPLRFAFGKEKSKAPPSPPPALALDFPSPTGGETELSRPPEGASSRWVPPGLDVRFANSASVACGSS
jgi:hypothetical protein